MGNPLFDKGPSQRKGSGGILEMIYNKMYRDIPEFRDLANSAKGKPLDQAFAEHGQDYSQYRNMSENDIAQMLTKNGML